MSTHSNLSIGTEAGIGVGAEIAALVAVLIAILLPRRRKQNRPRDYTNLSSATEKMEGDQGSAIYADHAEEVRVHEAEGVQLLELNSRMAPVELAGKAVTGHVTRPLQD